MNQNKNINKQITLHQAAIHCLECSKTCKKFNDAWGVEFYNNIYTQLISDLNTLHIEHAIQSIDDERMNYLFENGIKREMSDSSIDADGNIISLNELP